MIRPLFSETTGHSTAFQSGSINATFLRDRNHGGEAGQPAMVANMIAAFVAGARSTLHLSIYDFRLSDELGLPLVNNLIAQAKAGLDVKIAHDHTTPNNENLPPGQAVDVLALYGGEPKVTQKIPSPA